MTVPLVEKFRLLMIAGFVITLLGVLLVWSHPSTNLSPSSQRMLKAGNILAAIGAVMLLLGVGLYTAERSM